MQQLEEFKKLTDDLEQYKNKPIILSIKKYLLFSVIINISARIKGREPFSHTAYVFFKSKKWWVAESNKADDFKLTSLYDYCFTKRKKGKCILQVVPICKVQEDVFQNNIKYSTSKAILSWFLGSKNVDHKKGTYCTDFALDLSERATKTSIYPNNSAATPASLVEYFRKKFYKEILIYKQK